LTIAQLLYTSKARPNLAKSELDAILVSAQRNNAKIGVTGFLLFDGVNFVQLLEGAERDVQQIYRRVCSDDRHSNVEALLQENKPHRSLSNWAMAYSHIDAEGPREFGGSMNGSDAQELIALLKHNPTPMRLIISDFLSDVFSRRT